MNLIATSAAIAATLLFAATAQAQQAQQAAPRAYVELGHSWLDAGDGIKPTAIRGIVGYSVHPNLAIEGMAAFGAASDNAYGADVKLRDAYGIFLKPKVDVDKFELFARLGYAKVTAKATYLGYSVTGSDSDFAYGVGASYNFTPNVYGTLDYLRLSATADSGKTEAITLGVGYRF